ncbi:MAG: hypothetical protein A2293_08745 [Elusimicrobia bacterium RIFOXYB2_FULL_49_7]|nr:MAG: hypothetical protein A2293_08745 [Elusimicrobia bacterium RIFOXYB2_FULL_49_7]
MLSIHFGEIRTFFPGWFSSIPHGQAQVRDKTPGRSKQVYNPFLFMGLNIHERIIAPQLSDLRVLKSENVRARYVKYKALPYQPIS